VYQIFQIYKHFQLKIIHNF